MTDKISIIEVDKNSVTKNNSFPEAYALRIMLSSFPDAIWKNYFRNNYKNMWYSMKRQVNIIENTIILVFAESDNIQNHINFINQVINKANENYEEYLIDQENLRKRNEDEIRQEQERKNRIQNKLDDLKF